AADGIGTSWRSAGGGAGNGSEAPALQDQADSRTEEETWPVWMRKEAVWFAHAANDELRDFFSMWFDPFHPFHKTDGRPAGTKRSQGDAQTIGKEHGGAAPKAEAKKKGPQAGRKGVPADWKEGQPLKKVSRVRVSDFRSSHTGLVGLGWGGEPIQMNKRTNLTKNDQSGLPRLSFGHVYFWMRLRRCCKGLDSVDCQC
ncbi:unnamed protein product, partial [Polarella glacialis]